MATWPQWTLLAYFFFALLVEARDHGKPKRGVDNFWIAAVALSTIITVLFFGGFWAPIGFAP